MPTVRELAAYLEAPFEGDGEALIQAGAPLDTAQPHEVSFAGGKALKQAPASRAGCLIVPGDYANTEQRTVIRVRDPRRAFARVLRLLHPEQRPKAGIHATAVVADSARLGEGVSVGPYVVIGEECTVGDGCVIGAHCVLGDHVRLGEQCRLYPRVTIYSRVEVGARCVLHAGAVLGADGFGFVREGDRYEKFPQVGRVVVGNDVEIGANSTVDRAAVGVTILEDGVKLDNLVHVGHNCRIGRNVLMAAQCGLGGGTVIEQEAILGGQCGIGDNVTIQAGAILGGKAGVLPGKILPGGGIAYWGVPARPVKEYFEMLAGLHKLPALRAEVNELKKRG